MYYRVVVLLLLSLLLPVIGQAATRNANPGNLTSQLAATGAGDTLILEEGTYNGHVNIPVSASGTSEGNRTLIRVATGATVTILRGIAWDNINPISYITIDGVDGTLVIDGQYNSAGCIICAFNGNHVTVKNLELKNGRDHGILGGGVNLQLIKLHIHHFGDGEAFGQPRCQPGPTTVPLEDFPYCHGMYLSTGPGPILVDGCQIHHGQGYAIELQDVSNVTVRNSTLWNPGSPYRGSGIAGSFLSGSNDIFYNNIIRGFYYFGIWGDNNTIYSNTIVNINAAAIRAAGTTIRNNILSNTGGIEDAGGNTFNNNLCSSAGPGCAIVANPQFAGASMDDFHLNAGSPAINAGFTLGSPYDVDIEGQPRPVNGTYDIGAYEFGGTSTCIPANCATGTCCGSSCCMPTPDPVGDLITLQCEGNINNSAATGFTVSNNNGVTFPTPGIINTASCGFNGINQSLTGPSNAALRPANFRYAAWCKFFSLPSADVCRLASTGVASVLGVNGAGLLFGYVNNGAAEVVGTTPIALNTTTLMGLGFDGNQLRLWQNNANPVSAQYSGVLSYTGSEVPAFGGVEPGKYCNAVCDNFRYGDGAWDQAGINLTFLEVPPAAGLTATHSVFTNTDVSCPTPIAAVDGNVSHNRSVPFAVSWSLHATGATFSEYTPPFCRVNGGARVKVTASSSPVQFHIDSIANLGDVATTNLLPLDGFTLVPGLYIADAPSTTNSANPKVTVAPGNHAEIRGFFKLSPTLSNGDVVQCFLHRESDAPLDADPPTIANLTVVVPAAPTPGSVTTGTSTMGGTRQ